MADKRSLTVEVDAAVVAEYDRVMGEWRETVAARDRLAAERDAALALVREVYTDPVLTMQTWTAWLARARTLLGDGMK